ncbi:DinB family protein [Agrococcus sp. SL85]|uniref:DinB family protein n=1 Tax=Agrococcus sp. SL85 TaxID=2995141 RepID=UPI00226CE9ED|nr:DinB family protein [Agrococcus sp. SL85]WAC65968.1 DinB family protein [Agrococcus sp. SL85]
MTEHRGEDLAGDAFVDVSLRGARFVRADLSDVVMRGVELAGADLDAPWLLDGESVLLVNGVDVAPLVDAALDARYPGRRLRRAHDLEDLQACWAAAQRTWAATIARAERMPAGAVDERVDGEWSLAQTIRHLVMATDTWLRRGILRVDAPFHPIGQPNEEYAADGNDTGVFSEAAPSWARVLEVRADRVAMVDALLATATPALLDEPRANPWAPEHPETVRSCLHTILEEEWEHHRYAERDLAVLEARPERGSVD